MLTQLIGIAIMMLYFWATLRVLNPMITRVRARHGLRLAWGVAILGLLTIFGGVPMLIWLWIVLTH